VEKRIYGNGLDTCPELKWTGERYICNLCVKPVIGADYKEELYIGAGCCSNLNSWRQDVKPRRKQDVVLLPESNIDPLFQKFLYCLSREWISGDTIYLTLSSLGYELEKDGVPKEEIGNTLKKIGHYLQGGRSKMVKNFMG
jgi:hypothetical protein